MRGGGVSMGHVTFNLILFPVRLVLQKGGLSRGWPLKKGTKVYITLYPDAWALSISSKAPL